MTETEKEKCKHTIVSLGITQDDADYFLHLFQITFKFKIPVLLRAFLVITSLTGIVFGFFINEEFYYYLANIRNNSFDFYIYSPEGFLSFLLIILWGPILACIVVMLPFSIFIHYSLACRIITALSLSYNWDSKKLSLSSKLVSWFEKNKLQNKPRELWFKEKNDFKDKKNAKDGKFLLKLLLVYNLVCIPIVYFTDYNQYTIINEEGLIYSWFPNYTKNFKSWEEVASIKTFCDHGSKLLSPSHMGYKVSLLNGESITLLDILSNYDIPTQIEILDNILSKLGKPFDYSERC